MQRILRQTGAAISVTVYVDGTATDPSPDSATIKVEREDGTTLVAAGTATINAGTGVFTFNLTPTHTASLDVLKATWTYTRAGNAEQLVTYHEVVGGLICSLSQIDAALNKGGTASSYALADKQTARDIATEEFEKDCGVAFAPRYRRVKLDGDGTYDVMLPVPRPLAVTAATVDGAAISDLADLELYDTGLVYRPTSWAAGRRNVQLKVEHGFPTPPADIADAAATAAASALKDGPFDDRGYGVTDEGGAVRLLTAGVQSAMSSIPKVEAALRRHRYVVVA